MDITKLNDREALCFSAGFIMQTIGSLPEDGEYGTHTLGLTWQKDLEAQSKARELLLLMHRKHHVGSERGSMRFG